MGVGGGGVVLRCEVRATRYPAQRGNCVGLCTLCVCVCVCGMGAGHSSTMSQFSHHQIVHSVKPFI